MNSKLFIPDKIKVGFNPRKDTYTGLLGYIIGHDGKKWRKEPSWESWRYEYLEDNEFEKYKNNVFNNHLNSLRHYEHTKERIEEFERNYDTFTPHGKISNDPKIKPREYENVPIEGFVLNKKVGGISYGWNNRQTYSRVYDPRGFEFEITIQNLLFILQECNAYKGKGLEGTFVYSWDGKDLVLLPTSCQEYQECKKFTKLQHEKISTKDLIAGCAYKTKQLDELIYLGKFNWSDIWLDKINIDKQYVFYNVKDNRLLGLKALTSLAQRITDTPVENYAELLDLFNTSNNFCLLNNLTIEEFSPKKEVRYYDKSLDNAYLQIDDNTFEVYDVFCEKTERNSYFSHKSIISTYYVTCNKIIQIVDGGVLNIKKITPKKVSDLSYRNILDMGLKTISINKNNKTFKLQF
jgi:hypothetical protein